jgi:tRNA A37 threonylcarbamoyladenosine biosynthesis protein TsaE
MLLLVSTLLLTGKSGAGKTSIVKSAAKRVQENPKAFTCEFF